MKRVTSQHKSKYSLRGSVNSENQSSRLTSRRELLRLGAVGIPMVVTMKASATEALVSQLRCSVTMPGGYWILIRHDGAVWIGNTKHGDKKLTPGKVRQFKRDAEFEFPAGTAPDRFRPPSRCSRRGRGWGWWDWWGWGYGYNSQSTENVDQEDDQDQEQGENRSLGISSFSNNNGNDRNTSWWWWGDDGRDDDDDDRDDDDDDDDRDDDDDDDGRGNNEDLPTQKGEVCNHSLMEIDRDEAFKIADIVSTDGRVDLESVAGLYVFLAFKHAESGGRHSNLPGISCIASVMDYLQQN